MSKTMQYEETPVKKSKVSHKQVALQELSRVSTGAIIWYLVKRHKFGLVTTWAIIVTLFYTVPFLPDLLFNLI